MTNQRCLLLFEQAIKSKITKKSYLYQLEKFRQWAKIKDFNGLLQAPQKDIQILLEDYVMYLKNIVSPNSIPIYFAPIELFYVMNDVNLNFKKIRKLFPEKIKKGNERGYTQKDIEKILKNTKTKRHKALVLLFASSGVRLGAIQDIRLYHLTKIESSYAIKIYEGEKEEDFVFTTPECTNAIDDYRLERESDGECINEDSPLIRTTYRLGIEKVKSCDSDSLSHIMGRLVRVINRKKNTKTNRFDIAKNHGFRKFFATVIKNTPGITPTMTEKLINHIGVVRLDAAYYKPSLEQMFTAYKLAIPELIIDSTEKLQIKNEKLESEKSELEKEKENQESFKDQIDTMKQELEELKYGPTARRNKYNQNYVNAPVPPEMKILTMGIPILLELLFPEEKKQDMMKEFEKADLENRKPDLHKIFGSRQMDEENIRFLKQYLKEHQNKKDSSKSTNYVKPRLRIENLQAMLPNHN